MYVHDDNFGPSVRCSLEEVEGEIATSTGTKKIKIAELVTSPPAYAPNPEPQQIIRFNPTLIVAATHSDINVTPDQFHIVALNKATAIKTVVETAIGSNLELSVGTRFIKISEYLSDELGRYFSGSGALLGRIRLDILESVSPMSLHIGVVRIEIDGDLVMDILHDTTDCDPNRKAFAHLVFDRGLKTILDQIDIETRRSFFGIEVIAHDQ